MIFRLLPEEALAKVSNEILNQDNMNALIRDALTGAGNVCPV